MNLDTRNNWGMYSKTKDFSDISTPNDIRETYFLVQYDKVSKKYVSVDEKQPKQDLSGGSFMDTLKSNLSKISKGVSKAVDVYSGPTGTAIRNMIPASDENARPAFAGEKHAVLLLPNGKNGTANYMGPGTEVIKRLQRNDPGRTPADSVAKRHDIDYVLAAGEKTKDEQLVKTREADNRMIKSLQKMRETKGDAPRNINMGLRLIQAKVKGEDMGLADKSKFAGPLVDISASDKILLDAERKKSEQSGYGIDGKLLPGQKLKMSLLTRKVKGPKAPRTDPDMDSRLAGSGYVSILDRKNKGQVLTGKGYVSMSKDLVTKKGYVLKGQGLKLAGQGLNIAGGAFNIIDMLKDKVIPALMKELKLNIPTTEIIKVVDKYIKNPNDTSSLPSDLLGLSKELLPLTIMYKMKQAKINPLELQKKGIFTQAIKMSGSGKKRKGNGLKLAGQGGQGMKGSGIIDNINELLGPVKDVAIEALKNGMMEFIKTLIKGKSGNGMIMTGSGFWSDFADGFKTGFVNTLNILKVPVSLIAPELAPAFEIGSVIGKVLPGKMLYTI